ncbi:hypothetical protein N0V95_005286 [Ascochyta clinopodiicola]|nr:hypothetical protein N0V95_005286 [Ascochyta clinopodiicola]
MLAHLPKFVNWIMQHNDPVEGSDWPCRPEDPNQQLPADQETDKAILKMDQKLIKGCVLCRLKAIMMQYWGKILVGTNEEPKPFAHSQASTLPLHKMAERWINQRRHNEFKALFSLQYHEEIRCSHCNALRGITVYENSEQTGFSNIKPVAKGRDNLLAALERSPWLRPDTNDVLICATCKEAGATITRQLEAAPEYLRIHLDLTKEEEEGETSLPKNRIPIQIIETLDLTHHALIPEAGQTAWPLSYKLISVLYHAGQSVTNGHWTAGVSRPIPKPQRGKRDPNAASAAYYFCNDEVIRKVQAAGGVNPLTMNPVKKAGLEFNAVVLVYERLPRVAPKKDYTAELETELDDTYYSASKERSDGKKGDGNKRKRGDDGEEKGLRRSKRLKEKNM